MILYNLKNYFFARAVRKVVKTIKKDEDLYIAYKANIAMAFKDEYDRTKVRGVYLNRRDIHKIANNAAVNFLNLWTRGA